MIGAGDTAWVLVCTGLVMLMTPGLAFFYGGMVKRKNTLGILMQCFVALCVLTLQWVLFGYSLCFSPWSKIIGGLSWIGLQGSGLPRTLTKEIYRKDSCEMAPLLLESARRVSSFAPARNSETFC